MAKQITWTLSKTTKTEAGEKVYYYVADGDKLVKFQAGKNAFEWLFYPSTNVSARVRNKMVDGFIAAMMAKTDINKIVV